jgi:O-antigen/teichoic acid export membrane protein
MLNRSLYLASSKLLGYGIRLILPYFLVRLMTVADFGAYRQFFLLDIYISTLFQLGVNQSLFYFIPRDPRNAGAYFINSLLMNLVVFSSAYSIIGAFREPLSAWLKMAILREAFGPLTAFTMSLMLIAACDCYLNARQLTKVSAFFEIAGQVLASIVTVVTAFATRSLYSIILCLVAARAVQLLAMLAYIHFRLDGFGAQRYFFGLREQIRYGIALGLAGTVWAMLQRLHEFFVSGFYGTESYAIYSAGCTEVPIIQIFTQSVAVVALGQFALLEQQGDWQGVRQLWKRVLTSSYAVALPTITLFLLVSKPLILFMFTKTYADAIPIFRINTILKLYLVFNATLVLRAMNRNDISIKVNLATLAAAPGLLYLGMRVGGMVGIIAAQAVLMISSWLGMTVLLNRITRERLPYLVGVRDLAAFYREAWQKSLFLAGAGWRRIAAAAPGGHGGRR